MPLNLSHGEFDCKSAIYRFEESKVKRVKKLSKPKWRNKILNVKLLREIIEGFRTTAIIIIISLIGKRLQWPKQITSNKQRATCNEHKLIYESEIQSDSIFNFNFKWTFINGTCFIKSVINFV